MLQFPLDHSTVIFMVLSPIENQLLFSVPAGFIRITFIQFLKIRVPFEIPHFIAEVGKEDLDNEYCHGNASKYCGKNSSRNEEIASNGNKGGKEDSLKRDEHLSPSVNLAYLLELAL